MSADPIDATWIAHVAEVLEDFHGATDCDATADYAYNLLAASPELREMASQYDNGDAGREWLVDAVNTAVQINTDDFCCPTATARWKTEGHSTGGCRAAAWPAGTKGSVTPTSASVAIGSHSSRAG